MRKISFLPQHCFHGSDDRTHVGFQANSPDASLSGLICQLLGEVNCDHKNRDFRKQLRHLPSNVKSIQIWHLEIKQDHIGRVFLNPLERFSSRPSLATNAPAGLEFKEAAQIMEDSRVVIGD
jgi:hypothetical protein